MAMDVYLIPVSADRYELYCEHIVEDAALSPEAPAGTGRFAAGTTRIVTSLSASNTRPVRT